MECMIEFGDSPIRFEFDSQGFKQKILLDVLLKYSELDLNSLALVLDVAPNEIQDVFDEKCHFSEKQANDLAHLFLIFLGRTFFSKISIVRRFLD